MQSTQIMGTSHCVRSHQSRFPRRYRVLQDWALCTCVTQISGRSAALTSFQASTSYRIGSRLTLPTAMLSSFSSSSLLHSVSRQFTSIALTLSHFAGSPTTSVFYPHYSLWLYFRPLDRRRHLIPRRSHRRTYRLYNIPLHSPWLHIKMARQHHHHETRRSCHWKTPKTIVSHPACTIPI